MTTAITYKELRQMEKKRAIARTKCQICKQPIGDSKHVMFEERYFHLNCLRKER